MKLSIMDTAYLDTLNFNLPDTKQVKCNLSSGLNHLDIPPFYLDFLKDELDYKEFIKDYSECAGNRVLVESLKAYEKLLSDMPYPTSDNHYADHLAVTAGASMAIVHLIEYLAVKCSTHRFIFLGLHYFLFFQLMSKYGLPYTLLTDRENINCRNAPTVREIGKEICKDNRPVVVFLTMPFNPTGENYTSEEFSSIIALLKKKVGSLLVIDKCQQDELHMDSYVNFGHLINKERFVDQAIIINSFSKTRSIPGIRLGYIFGNDTIVQYIILKIKYSYYCHPQIFIFPIIADLFIRLLYTCKRYGYEDTGVLKQFNQIIARNSGLALYTKYIRKIFMKVNECYTDYTNQILMNYKTIHNNYTYCIDQLEPFSEGYTQLRGGFNFSIRFKKMQSKNQLKHCADIIQHTGLLLMPECYFNGSEIFDSDDPFWFRITLAFPQKKFRTMIHNLKDYLAIH